MMRPGLEISDTPQESIIRDEIHRGPYLKTPSLVLASSGMLNTGTLSYNLAQLWMARPNFGIAFIGYQHPTTPGHALSVSPKKQPFDLAGRRVTRTCEVERFRFSAHASRESLIELVTDVRPSTLVLMHGEPESCDSLALDLRERLPGMRICIPRKGVSYTLSSD
jgi:Cft2 family RNA processing exonuclease